MIQMTIKRTLNLFVPTLEVWLLRKSFLTSFLLSARGHIVWEIVQFRLKIRQSVWENKSGGNSLSSWRSDSLSQEKHQLEQLYQNFARHTSIWCQLKLMKATSHYECLMSNIKVENYWTATIKIVFSNITNLATYRSVSSWATFLYIFVESWDFRTISGESRTSLFFFLWKLNILLGFCRFHRLSNLERLV